MRARPSPRASSSDSGRQVRQGYLPGALPPCGFYTLTWRNIARAGREGLTHLRVLEQAQFHADKAPEKIYPMTHAPDHERAGEIYGATFIMLGCPFTIVLTRLASGYGRLWYRPAALLVGDGRIDLDWSQPSTTEPIVLLVPPAVGEAH